MEERENKRDITRFIEIFYKSNKIYLNNLEKSIEGVQIGSEYFEFENEKTAKIWREIARTPLRVHPEDRHVVNTICHNFFSKYFHELVREETERDKVTQQILLGQINIFDLEEYEYYDLIWIEERVREFATSKEIVPLIEKLFYREHINNVDEIKKKIQSNIELVYYVICKIIKVKRISEIIRDLFWGNLDYWTISEEVSKEDARAIMNNLAICEKGKEVDPKSIVQKIEEGQSIEDVLESFEAILYDKERLKTSLTSVFKEKNEKEIEEMQKQLDKRAVLSAFESILRRL